MADAYLRHTPLAHLHLDARAANESNDNVTGVTMGERQLLGMINIRGQPNDPAFAPTIKNVLGIGLPDTVNSVSGNKVSGMGTGLYILGLGPDEWLVITPKNQDINLHSKLIKALVKATPPLHATATLTGDAHTVIQIAGPRARDTLAKGCPLDLHPRAFTPGRCAQTILARSDMTIHQTAGDAYDIIVLRSFAEYAWTWLEDAAREYGVRVIAGL